MFTKVLIANRGEIAVRVIRTLRRMGLASVAVYSDADRFSLAPRLADEAVRIGPAPAAESYLDVNAVIRACEATGAQAVHPGYGFLSESIGFAERLAAEGIAFIGPRPEHLSAFGLKHTARELAEATASAARAARACLAEPWPVDEEGFRKRCAEAKTRLQAIGALGGDGRITAHGKALASIPLPVPLAHMLLDAARAGEADQVNTSVSTRRAVARARAHRRRGVRRAAAAVGTALTAHAASGSRHAA